jgi:hypothetical protein
MKHKTQMDFAYEFLLDGPKTVRQVAEHLGVDTKKAACCLYRLRETERVKYEGNSKYGMYSIPNHNSLPKHHPRIGIWGL